MNEDGHCFCQKGQRPVISEFVYAGALPLKTFGYAQATNFTGRCPLDFGDNLFSGTYHYNTL